MNLAKKIRPPPHSDVTELYTAAEHVELYTVSMSEK